jgi:hypothetical protein
MERTFAKEITMAGQSLGKRVTALEEEVSRLKALFTMRPCDWAENIENRPGQR